MCEVVDVLFRVIVQQVSEVGDLRVGDDDDLPREKPFEPVHRRHRDRFAKTLKFFKKKCSIQAVLNPGESEEMKRKRNVKNFQLSIEAFAFEGTISPYNKKLKQFL